MNDTARLSPAEIAHFLRAATRTLAAELAGAPERVLAWHPAAGAWCAKEVLGHLIESERRGFAGRIRLMLAGNEPSLEAWDQGEFARARRDCEHPAAALIAERAALRRDSVSLVAALGGSDLTRGGH